MLKALKFLSVSLLLNMFVLCRQGQVTTKHKHTLNLSACSAHDRKWQTSQCVFFHLSAAGLSVTDNLRLNV